MLHLSHPINFDDGGYKITTVGENTTYITGMTLNFATAPTTSRKLEISMESYYQKDRNRCLFSKDMKCESELNLLSNNPIELREGEKLWIDYPNIEGIVISGELRFFTII